MNTTKKIKKTFHIFLDIDGVLNNEHHYVSGEARLPNNDFTHFSPTLVKRFNDMCDEIAKTFDLKVVLSSSHRLGMDNEKSAIYLKENGIKHPCEGRTISVRFSHIEGMYYVEIPRGVEIDEYINRMEIGHYIILDDDSDFLLDQKDHFFQTNSYDGLTEDVVEEIKGYAKNCHGGDILKEMDLKRNIKKM